MTHTSALKISFLGLCLIPSSAIATVERTLTPHVSIFNQSNSGSIEITAPETQFVIPYSIQNETFLPLDINFNVISLNDTSIDYRLTLPVSQHYCSVDNQDSVLTLKQITIDGTPIASSSSSLPGHEGIVETDIIKKKHVLTVTYPEISRGSSSIFCYGTLGIQAEVIL